MPSNIDLFREEATTILQNMEDHSIEAVRGQFSQLSEKYNLVMASPAPKGGLQIGAGIVKAGATYNTTYGVELFLDLTYGVGGGININAAGLDVYGIANFATLKGTQVDMVWSDQQVGIQLQAGIPLGPSPFYQDTITFSSREHVFNQLDDIIDIELLEGNRFILHDEARDSIRTEAREGMEYALKNNKFFNVERFMALQDTKYNLGTSSDGFNINHPRQVDTLPDGRNIITEVFEDNVGDSDTTLTLVNKYGIEEHSVSYKSRKVTDNSPEIILETEGFSIPSHILNTAASEAYLARARQALTDKCFAAGTKILTPSGAKNIEEIQVGDVILAFDPKEKSGRDSLVEARVVQLFQNESDELCDLDGLRVTAGHRFFTSDGTFKQLDDFSEHDSFVDAEGNVVPFKEPKKMTGIHTVYNFEVEGLHTYVAGGYRVHNDSLKAGDRITEIQLTETDTVFHVYNENGYTAKVTETENANGELQLRERIETHSGEDVIVTKRYDEFDANENPIDDAEIDIEQNAQIISWEQMGDHFGSQLAIQLTDDVLSQIAVDALLSTSFEFIAETLALTGSSIPVSAGGGQVSLDQALELSAAELGTDAAVNLAEAGASAVMALVLAELFDELGIEGFAGDVLQSATSASLNTVTNQVIQDGGSFANWDAGLTTANLETVLHNAAGAFLGNYAAAQAHPPETDVGQFTSAIASIAAIAAVSGAALPVVVLATFFASVLGGELGDLFGDSDTPEGSGVLGFDPVTNQFFINHTNVYDGGSQSYTEAVAQGAIETLNKIINTDIGGKLQAVEGAEIHAGSYGHVEGNIANWEFDGRGSNHKEFNADQTVQMYGYGIAHTLQGTEIVGGNVYVKRALNHLLEETLFDVVRYQPSKDVEGQDFISYDGYIGSGTSASRSEIAQDQGGLAPDDFLSVYSGAQIVARDYQKYLNETIQINTLIQEDIENPNSIAWLATIAQAGALGLDSRQVSDWWGGWKGVLEHYKVDLSSLDFSFDGFARVLNTLDTSGGSVVFEDTVTEASKEKFAAASEDSRLIIANDQVIENAGFDGINGQNAEQGEVIEIASFTAGGNGNDYIKTSDGGDDVLGGAGNDTIEGGTLDDWLLGGEGNDLLIAGGGHGDYLDGGAGDDVLLGDDESDWLEGGAGNDVIQGAGGNDYLIGGEGVDLLDGGEGADTYLYANGDGLAVVQDSGAVSDQDVVYLEDVELIQTTIYASTSDDDFIVQVEANNGTDLIVLDESAFDGVHGVEVLEDYSGTEYHLAYLPSAAVVGTGQVLNGTPGSEEIFGTLSDDDFTGFAGNDTMHGGAGSDDYFFSAGFGQDVVYDVGLVSDIDTVHFDSTFSANNMLLTRSHADSNQVTLSFTGSSDALTLDNIGIAEDSIEQVMFADGTVYTIGDLKELYLAGGTSAAEVIYGFADNDVIHSFAGNDTIYGGYGDDILSGGEHNDTYIYHLGDGHDVIIDQGDDNNILLFGKGITAENIELHYNPNDLNDVLVTFEGELGSIRVQDYLAAGQSITEFEFTDDTGAVTSSQDVLDLLATQHNTITNGTVSSETLSGTGGNDFIHGQAGNDNVSTGGGNDTLIGGQGVDTLDGGLGDDTYIYQSGDGHITIQEAQLGNDTLIVQGVQSSGLETSLVQSTGDWKLQWIGGSATIKEGYQTTVETFQFDDVTIAREDLSDYIDLSMPNSISGNSSSETLYGTLGADYIAGQNGNDTIYGGTGTNSASDIGDIVQGMNNADWLYGNGGNDLIYGGSHRDNIWGGYGNDTVFGGDGETDAGDSADTIRGQNGNDSLYGNAGNDTIYGGFDSDTIHGGAGNDRIYGGNDINDSSDASDLIYGDSGNDLIYANSGGDTVYGGDGNDSIYGGVGNDTIYGGLGDDHYYHTSLGGHIVVEEEEDGHDVLHISYVNKTAITATLIQDTANWLISWGSGSATIINKPNATIEEFHFDDGVVTHAQLGDYIHYGSYTNTQNGSAGDNLLTGTSQSDSLNGGDGNDTVYGGTSEVDPSDAADLIIGGAGNDVLYGNGGDDSIFAGLDLDTVYGGEGNDTIMGGDRQTDAADSDDLLLGQTGNDLIYANAGNDQVFGGGDADTVRGGIGNDTIYGGNGEVDGADLGDVLIGDEGDDHIHGNSGDDEIYGGIGSDSIFAGGDNDTVYGGRYELDPDDASDLIHGWEGNDHILGNGGDDTLFGGDNADYIHAGEGNDTIYGGNGVADAFDQSDVLIGSNGDDVIYGNAGNDAIYGGNDNDTLYSGLGNDYVYGGFGDDTYIYNSGDGHIVIGDDLGTDTLQFNYGVYADRITVTEYNNDLTIRMVNSEDSITIKNGAVNPIDYYQFADGSVLNFSEIMQLQDSHFGGNGDEVLNGTQSDNTLTGGLGNDQLRGGSGADEYHFNLGDGRDTIYDAGGTSDVDIIKLGAGITADMVQVTSSRFDANDLVLNIGEDGDSIYLNEQFNGHAIEELHFADGTVWNSAQLVATNGVVTGTGSAELIRGTIGDDTIESGDGNDTLSGGSGADSYTIAASSTSIIIDDTGTDSGQDTVILDSALAADYSSSLDTDTGTITLTSANQTITFNHQLGAGSKGVEAINFQDTVKMTTEYIQEHLDDQVTSGDDEITGFDTDDTLSGGAGNDTLTGGAGADTYVYDITDGHEVVQEYAGAETDVLQVTGTIDPLTGITVVRTDGWNDDIKLEVDNDNSVTIRNAASDNGFGVEEVHFQNADVTWTKANLIDEYFQQNTSAGDDEVQGFSIADTIEGGDGHDSIQGAGGDDSIEGGAGNDVINAGIGADTVEGGVGDDELYGSSGNDELIGGEGNDTLSGGFDNDTLEGGEGKDTLTGNESADQFVFSDTSHSVRSNGQRDAITDFDIEADSIDLSNLEFAGIDIGQNTPGLLRVFYSNSTDRTYFRDDDGSDFEFYLEGNYTETVENGGQGVITHENFELYTPDLQIIRGTQAADTLAGSNGNDLLLGYGAKDHLYGHGGNDTLDGGHSEDSVLSGGEGMDVFRFRSLTDSIVTSDKQDTIIDFEVGVDKIDLSGLGYHSIVNGSTNSGEVRLAYSSGSDRTFIRNEQSTFEVVLDGDYTGLITEEDIIFGEQDNQIIGKHSLEDVLHGTSGNDALHGFKLNDELFGHAGNDMLDGGQGQDDLTGGAGADTFRFTHIDDTVHINSSTMDRVLDFQVGVDQLDISALGLTGISFGKNSANGNTEIAEVYYSVSSDRTYVRQNDGESTTDDFSFYLAGNYADAGEVNFQGLLTTNDFVLT